MKEINTINMIESGGCEDKDAGVEVLAFVIMHLSGTEVSSARLLTELGPGHWYKYVCELNLRAYI
ncbi:MAG TPA: hypothetical protein VK666_18680 [Chryseolinea sp.]|nr:hypothetical protein [Chryseolinea sp.]